MQPARLPTPIQAESNKLSIAEQIMHKPEQQREQSSQKTSVAQSIMQPTSIPIKAGETARILLTDRKRITGKITAIQENQLFFSSPGIFSQNKAKRIPFNQVVFIERRTKQGKNDWSRFPLIEEHYPNDSNLACNEIERQLLHVDVLRRAINEEIAWLATDMFDAALGLQWTNLASAQMEHAQLARVGVSKRMIQLLTLSQSMACTTPLEKQAKLTRGEILDKVQHLGGTHDLGEQNQGSAYYSQIQTVLNKAIRY